MGLCRALFAISFIQRLGLRYGQPRDIHFVFREKRYLPRPSIWCLKWRGVFEEALGAVNSVKSFTRKFPQGVRFSRLLIIIKLVVQYKLLFFVLFEWCVLCPGLLKGHTSVESVELKPKSSGFTIMVFVYMFDTYSKNCLYYVNICHKFTIIHYRSKRCYIKVKILFI